MTIWTYDLLGMALGAVKLLGASAVDMCCGYAGNDADPASA